MKDSQKQVVPPQPAEPTGATGTYNCPVCGKDSPHSHTQQEIERSRECLVVPGAVTCLRASGYSVVADKLERLYRCLEVSTAEQAERDRVASHPAEPETPSHPCPRCGEACVCAEGFDGDRCQHFRIGCKSAAPAEPERDCVCGHEHGMHRSPGVAQCRVVECNCDEYRAPAEPERETTRLAQRRKGQGDVRPDQDQPTDEANRAL